MVQFSRGGGQFFAGKTADNTDDAACIAGCVAGALMVRETAKLYGVPVVLHTDHCMKSWLPWFDGLIDANEAYFKQYGVPLFSSHMLDLSEEPLEENIAICKKYLERMAKMDLLLEMELGVTGGEEDGVDNTEVDNSLLYTQPEEVWAVYKELSTVPNGAFTIAAAFGNVHGVYAPGNVKLTPEILHNSQAYIKEKLGTDNPKPVFFVFHGGSGSSREEIRYAIEAGTIKMNIDTDTQWSYWDGIRCARTRADTRARTPTRARWAAQWAARVRVRGCAWARARGAPRRARAGRASPHACPIALPASSTRIYPPPMLQLVRGGVP